MIRRFLSAALLAALLGGYAFQPALAGERVVRVSVVSQLWRDDDRTVEAVRKYVQAAADQSADIIVLPAECVRTDGEPIPGPISQALASEAARLKLYVIGTIREKDGGRTYLTSFLLGREGKLIGKYRKSHRMPDEEIDLGDELPVFATDFGPVAMRIGTDRFFPEIDHVYCVRQARMIFWAQAPEPVEDEFSQDMPVAGRAADYNMHFACSRYASGRKDGYITNFYPPYCGMPIGRSYVVNREGQRIASTPRAGGVATATIPLSQLQGGRGPVAGRAFAATTQPAIAPARTAYTKRRVRVTVIEGHLPIDQFIERLEEAGRLGSDIVCSYEFVWISGRDEAQARQAKANLQRVAAQAAQHKMYVLVAGVVDHVDRNEAILFGRDGREVGRYFKMVKTHPEQIVGEETPVFETDFGRVACRICADECMVDLDRCYGLKRADILFTPTQSWGPDALYRDLRDISRAMDYGLFIVECTHPSSEVAHRSMIVEPTGQVVARSEYRTASVLSAIIDLDKDRPLRYLRKYTPHKPGGYLPEYQPDQMPASANDLRETILSQRRPSLYGVILDVRPPHPPAGSTPTAGGPASRTSPRRPAR